MGKVNLYIKSCLINEEMEYNIKGILQDNKIKYQDKDAKMIIDMNNNILERIKKEERYLFDFNNNICITKTSKFEVSIPIKVLECNNKNNNMFFVKYQIENNLYEYKINILEEI